MAIIKHDHDSNVPNEVLFAGRVIRIEKVTESRNHSDTMDYTDYRPTECTYALVWLGTRGVPPYVSGLPRGRRIAKPFPSPWDLEKVRDLKPEEQFAWIDCTNLHSDRFGYSLRAEADEFGMQALHCGPGMFDALKAYDAA